MTRSEEITIRIYGEDRTWPRYRWEELLDDMHPASYNAGRISDILKSTSIATGEPSDD